MKKSATAAESGGEHCIPGGGWSLTLAATATGRPTDWTIAEAKLAPKLMGSRKEIVERTIRDTTVANLKTTNYSVEMVQRGFELYRAINGSNGVSADDLSLLLLLLLLLLLRKRLYLYYLAQL